jgi:hypothetical protein
MVSLHYDGLTCPSIDVCYPSVMALWDGTCPSIMGGCGSLASRSRKPLEQGVLLRSWYSETDD